MLAVRSMNLKKAIVAKRLGKCHHSHRKEDRKDEHIASSGSEQRIQGCAVTHRETAPSDDVHGKIHHRNSQSDCRQSLAKVDGEP